MPSLDEALANFIDTINEGPARLDPQLFAGPLDRILLGLRAHANTISHARLTALEQSFPKTRAHIGEAKFNDHSRCYVETREARASCTSDIGGGFPDFLKNRIDRQTIDLARIEWAWLQSYHAAEAVPLALTDLNGLDESALLALRVAPHPSVRVVEIGAPLAAGIEGLEGTKAPTILLVRPDEEVKALPLSSIQTTIFQNLRQKSAALGNLLRIAIELSDNGNPLDPILDLIGAGALVKAGWTI